MIATLACCALALLAPQRSERGFRRATLALEGPLVEVVLREPLGSTTTLEAELGPGAHLLCDVPVSGASVELVEGATFTARPEGGRVELRAVRAEGWDDPWLAVPARLRVRVRPPVEPAARSLDLVEASLLGAALVAAAALRRRPLVALATGACGAAALLVLPGARADAEPAVCVLEGDGASAQWLFVEARADEIELPPGGPLRLELDPEESTTAFHVEHGGGDGDRWRARASGARLVRVERATPPGSLAREQNTLADLAACWLREQDGAWSARGPWRRGEPLPPPRDDAGAASLPPGWLASGLPQGVAVVIGRIAAPDFEPARWTIAPGAAARSPWLRHVGF